MNWQFGPNFSFFKKNSFRELPRLVSRSQCSSLGATQISGLHSRLTQGVRPSLECKQRPPFSSVVVTGICWSTQSGLNVATPPVEFGERNRDCALGHGGKGMPSSRDDGGVSGFFSSGSRSVGFLTRYHAKLSEPLVGHQGSRVSSKWRGGSRHCTCTIWW